MAEGNLLANVGGEAPQQNDEDRQEEETDDNAGAFEDEVGKGAPLTVNIPARQPMRAVTVVPIFAPSTMGMAFSIVIRPCWPRMIRMLIGMAEA